VRLAVRVVGAALVVLTVLFAWPGSASASPLDGVPPDLHLRRSSELHRRRVRTTGGGVRPRLRPHRRRPADKRHFVAPKGTGA
jgi:hypothetical protein